MCAKKTFFPVVSVWMHLNAAFKLQMKNGLWTKSVMTVLKQL